MQTREYAIAVENWLDNVFTEVRSHDGGYLRALKHKSELRGGKIQFYYEFDDELEFKKTDIILDVGSGARPIYGNYMGEYKIDYRPFDALAFEYERLYEKYHYRPPVSPQFAVMEHLSAFTLQGDADWVICNNALDHTIDIMACFLELINVAKIGGSVLLTHHECEGENEEYAGFHQWNISYQNGEVRFYNKKHRYDVSQIIAPFASQRVKYVERGSRKGNLFIEFKKQAEVPLEILEKYNPSSKRGILLSTLMRRLASNGCFCSVSGNKVIPYDRKYVIFGTGEVAWQLLAWFGNHKTQITYFLDNRHADKTEFEGFDIKAVEEYSPEDGLIIIAVRRKDFVMEICKQLSERGLVKEKNFFVYDEWKKNLER